MNSQLPYTVIISGVPSDEKITCADFRELVEKHCGTTYARDENRLELALTRPR
jgi:hypothetical protein